MEPPALEAMAPSKDSVECHTDQSIAEASRSKSGLDLNQLESDTLSILQKYGSPGAKNARRIGAPVTLSSRRGEKARPWTGASSNFNCFNRSCRTAGGIAKTSNKVQDSRPFTSATRKQVRIEAIDDDCKLFKADGRARNVLRDTISSALSTSQFDSVPSLLASGKTNELPNINDGQALRRSSPFLRETSPYMVSVMGANKSTPKKTTSGEDLKESSNDSCKPKSLALRDIKYTGFDEGPGTDLTSDNKEGKQGVIMPEKEVCFNCWSAGEGNKCLIHTETPRSIASNPAGHNLSMCKNWNTDFLRRKYRSEEIEEHFSQKSQSLVFNKSHKEFSTLEQPKHPIYRLLTQHVARLNFTYQRRQNVQTWFQSFIKKLKDGKFEGKRSSASAGILLLRSTVKSMMAVRKLSTEVKDQHPKAPVTGTTRRERLGQEQVLVVKEMATIHGNKEKCNFVIAGPTPVPEALYRARKYEPPTPIKFVLNDGTIHDNSRLDFSSVMSSSIQYATFGRKRANENIAVGGLSAEMIVSQRFTGRFPPQYKNYTCKYEGTLVPPSVDEQTPLFPTMAVPPGELPYVRRELTTPLDSRLPPGIMSKTGIRPDDRHFFGLNRPEQTGEEEDFGFRTSTWYSLPNIDDKIDTNTFRPSESVATPNTPVLSPMRTMKVDGTYPFRKEQSRKNCVEDLYDLLLSDGKVSMNSLQMFTCIGSQQCGYFMQNGNSSLPIGRVVTKVVRSWAFLQCESEENAVYEEERTLLGLGGVVLKNRPRHAETMPSGVLTKNSRKDVRNAILKIMPAEHHSLVEFVAPPPTANRLENSNEKDFMNEYTAKWRETTAGVPGTEAEILVKEVAPADYSSKDGTKQKSSFHESLGSQPLQISDALSSNPSIQPKQEAFKPIAEITNKNGALVAESISQVIGESLKLFSANPEDLIRLGMGIGASLGAQGFLNLENAAQKNTDNKCASSEDEVAVPILDNEPRTSASDLVMSGVDDITIESCSSEESKLDYPPINNIVDERNFVNFSDMNPSPQGLLNVVAATRVGPKRVEYLSYTFDLNLPALRNIEPLKPRSMKEEWKQVDYDPWSDGREPTSSTFIRSLTHETKKWPTPDNRMEGSTVSNTAQEFKALCTLCRHGKYRELEEMINNPSWSLPIDFCDDSGNALLMIACQNGNKRIAKLCLRRGSQINNRNLNGNTCLHFAFGYGFDELGDYLISKGADDSLQNSNDLTCYEGLDMDML